MLIINSREFRANQSKYFNLAKQGEDVILKSKSLGSFKLQPITEDDTLIRKEEYYAMLDESKKQIENGQFQVLTSDLKKRLFEDL